MPGVEVPNETENERAMTDDSGKLSLEQAAEQAHLPARLVATACRRGLVPSAQIAGRTMIEPEAVSRFIESGMAARLFLETTRGRNHGNRKH